MIEIIGAPFDLCGFRRGSRLGPAALRLAGLIEKIEALDLEVRDLGDVACSLHEATGDGLRNFESLYDCLAALREVVKASLQAGNLPIVLGGEHTLAVSGISAALEHTNGDLALIWIDAHADINTPGTSSTGNVHGMPVALLQGRPSECSGPCDVQWNQLLNLKGAQSLSPSKTAWYAIRDVDAGERALVKQGLGITMHDIDRYGIDKTVKTMMDWINATGTRNLWISFDVDALDPFLAPGTGTAVRGGLSYREAHLFAELLSEQIFANDSRLKLRGIDVVETNPIVDSQNETAVLANEWIASLLGKKILG